MTRLLLSLVAVCLGSISLSQAADPPAKSPKDTCVKPCMDCAAECLKCMKHCREMKMEDMANMCEVCHHACLMCAHAVKGKTMNAWAACELCEKMCLDCAAMCDKGEHAQMKKNAEECRKCAKACADARK